MKKTNSALLAINIIILMCEAKKSVVSNFYSNREKSVNNPVSAVHLFQLSIQSQSADVEKVQCVFLNWT